MYLKKILNTIYENHTFNLLKFLKLQIYDKLSPYKKLYENAHEFMTKYDLWMNSKVGSFNPDDIDLDTSNLFRNIYKLEKTFSDVPAPRDLTSTVSFYYYII